MKLYDDMNFENFEKFSKLSFFVRKLLFKSAKSLLPTSWHSAELAPPLQPPPLLAPSEAQSRLSRLFFCYFTGQSLYPILSKLRDPSAPAGLTFDSWPCGLGAFSA